MAPARKRRAASAIKATLPEAAFQRQVLDLASRFNWWTWHDNDSRRNRSGLPDLILIRPPRVVFAELKAERGRMREEQERVLGMLAGCPGVESYVWRPSNWDEVVAALRPA